MSEQQRKELIDGLYRPTFLPEDIPLSDFIIDETEEKVKAVHKLKRKLNRRTGYRSTIGDDARKVPIPLTEKEAEEVDIMISNTLSLIDNTRKRIASIREFIDKSASTKDGNELSFKLDISKRPTLKRAIKKVFGIKTDTITYSMYKEALAAKRAIEDSEVKAYLIGEAE